MTNTLARIKQAGKHFEIIVDLESALKFRKGELSSVEVESDRIFSDVKKGFVASQEDLKKSFGTTDFGEIVKKIVKNGEVQLTQEHRDAEQEKKFKQVVDFLSKNSVNPQTGIPHSPERIKNALEQANVNIKNVTIENQIKDILSEISKVIPIKLEMKKVRIKIPAIYTGKAYGIVSQYKENERWLDNGDLEIVVSVPSGIIMEFYDKINSATHGSAITTEMRQDV